MSSLALRVSHLTKEYQRGRIQTTQEDTLASSLVQTLIAPIKRIRQVLSGQAVSYSDALESFLALDDVSFEVNHGEVIGIMGHNGAGKSTLLKVLSRITYPTQGQVELYGRIGSLLEVGTGFHQELTGRENVYLNGSILGMKRAEITRKFDEIVAFSEVGAFIDTPVKHYSSGMLVRLAFAVAAHLEPEILVIDEVLAVGDASFQQKSLGKMSEVAGAGRTVIFVSHNMSAINNLCQRGIVLNHGRVIYDGKTADAVTHYLSTLSGVQSEQTNPVYFQPKPQQILSMNSVSLTNSTRDNTTTIAYQEAFHVTLNIQINVPDTAYEVGVLISDNYGNVILFTTDKDFGDSAIAQVQSGAHTYTLDFPSRLLKPGRYYITYYLTQRPDYEVERGTNVIAFDIYDNESWRAMKNFYRKVAIVAPEIPWSFKENA